MTRHLRIDSTVDEMTERLSPITNTSIEDADMKVNMIKTFIHHVNKHNPITMTYSEVDDIETKYDHQ